MLNSVKGKKSRVPSQVYPEYPESRVSRVSRVSLKNPQEENPRFHEVNAFVSKSERSPSPKQIPSFTVPQLLRDVNATSPSHQPSFLHHLCAFTKTQAQTLPHHFYQIPPRRVHAITVPQPPPCHHHSSAGRARGLLARRSAHYPTWTVVTGSLDPPSLATSPIIPNPHCPAPTFAWAYYTLTLTNPALHKHQPAPAIHKPKQVHLPHSFYFIYHHPMHHINTFTLQHLHRNGPKV